MCEGGTEETDRMYQLCGKIGTRPNRRQLEVRGQEDGLVAIRSDPVTASAGILAEEEGRW